MFNKLYKGEIKKLLRPKTLIVLSSILLLILIIYAISYNFLTEVMYEITVPQEENNEVIEEGGNNEEIEGEMTPDEQMQDILFGNEYYARKYTEQEINILIAEAEMDLENAKEYKESNDFFFRLGVDPVYQNKGYLEALKYIKANNLYNQDIEIHSQTAIFSQKTAESFAQGFFNIMLTVIIIYGIAIGAGSFSSEMKNGTLKMLFMRPITRTKLTTAKILSLLTMITVILLGATLISYLYGLIRYGASTGVQGLIVFNAMSVFKGSKGLLFFMNIMFGMLQAYALCLFAFAVGTITKNRILAIITCILIYLDLIASILSLFKLGRFLFTTNANLGIYFGVSSSIPAGGNFFIALPIFIAYMAIFIAGTYLIFNKRDIA